MRQRRARGPTGNARRRSAAGVALLLAALWACGFSPPGLAQDGRHCWELPAGVTAEQAREEADAFGYWYEVYIAAEELLGRIERDAARESVKPADVDRAVTMLRLAIDERSASGLGQRTAAGPVDYVPYFRLAEALARKGDYGAARECMERDRPVIEREPRLAGRLSGVETEIARGFERQEFEQVIAEWRAWTSGGIVACLSESARARTSRITDSASSGADPDRARGEFVQSVLDLVREESSRLGTRLGELESASWAAVLAGATESVDTSQCGDPGGDPTVENARRAMGRLESCCEATERAMRRAGKAACAVLRQTRADIRTKHDTARQYDPGSTGSVPALPDACATAEDWDRRDFGTLWAAIDGLEFPATVRAYESERATAVARLEELQRGFRAALEQARASIVRAGRDCAGHLQLGESNDTLRALESRIDRALRDENLAPSDDLRDVEQQVVAARDALRTRADQGVTRLLGQPDAVQAEDRAAFARLGEAWSGFEQEPSQARLNSLCTVAADVRGAITAWGRNNLPQVQRRVAAIRWLLSAASERVPPGAGEALACIGERLESMPSRRVGANAVAWLDRATEATSLAEACLTDYHEWHERWTDGVRRDLAELSRMVSALPQSGVAPVDERTAALRQAVGDAEARLAGLDPLLQSSATDDVAALRERLGEAGLSVPDRRWREVEELGASDPREGLLAIRDEAVHEPLLEAARVVADHRPLVARLGSYVVLNGAFRRYATGDLDGAIESLRSAGSGTTESPDRGAAVRHAALAYFLHTKSTMLGAGGDGARVAGMLLADAEFEIRQALLCQQGFELPALLRRGAAFAEFFEEVSSE